MEAIKSTLHDGLCECFLNQKISSNDGILGRAQEKSALKVGDEGARVAGDGTRNFSLSAMQSKLGLLTRCQYVSVVGIRPFLSSGMIPSRI